MPKHYRQLWVKDLPKVLTWQLEWVSNLWLSGCKALNLPLSHHVPQHAGYISIKKICGLELVPVYFQGHLCTMYISIVSFELVLWSLNVRKGFWIANVWSSGMFLISKGFILSKTFDGCRDNWWAPCLPRNNTRRCYRETGSWLGSSFVC